MKASFNDAIAKAREDTDDEEKLAAKKKNFNITVLPSIAVLTAAPVNLKSFKSLSMSICLIAVLKKVVMTTITFS